MNEDGECVEVCGDGIRYSSQHECDDGNSENGDGCAETCSVEENYVCSGGDSSSADICLFVSTLSISSSSVDSSLILLVTLSHPVNFTGTLSDLILDFSLNRFSFTPSASDF